MNCGYFYAPYVPLDGDWDLVAKDPASKEEKPQEDFHYEVGEEVWVQGAIERQSGISWRAKITKRWYEEDNPKPHKYSPYWFVVEPINGDAPSYRLKNNQIIVSQLPRP